MIEFFGLSGEPGAGPVASTGTIENCWDINQDAAGGVAEDTKLRWLAGDGASLIVVKAELDSSAVQLEWTRTSSASEVGTKHVYGTPGQVIAPAFLHTFVWNVHNQEGSPTALVIDRVARGDRDSVLALDFVTTKVRSLTATLSQYWLGDATLDEDRNQEFGIWSGDGSGFNSGLLVQVLGGLGGDTIDFAAIGGAPGLVVGPTGFTSVPTKKGTGFNFQADTGGDADGSAVGGDGGGFDWGLGEGGAASGSFDAGDAGDWTVSGVPGGAGTGTNAAGDGTSIFHDVGFAGVDNGGGPGADGVYAINSNVTGGNTGIGTASEFGSGDGVVGIKDAATNPSTNPAGGGVLYVNAGALTYRGSGGTVTVLGAA